MFFFLLDEEFVSKTINNSSVDLDKFHASRVRQLVKKMEASKATVRHIKLVASDLQAAQINLLRHQQTDLPPGKQIEKPSNQDYRVTSNIQVNNKVHHTTGSLIPNRLIQVRIGVLNVVIPSMLKDSCVKPRNISARPATSMDILQACVSRNKLLSNQKHNNYKLGRHACKMTPCAASQKILPLAMILFASK